MYQQAFKIWLTSFNPLWYMYSLHECPDQTGVSKTSTTTQSRDPGQNTIATNFRKDIKNFIIRFAGHYNCYRVINFNNGVLTLSDNLVEKVEYGETIYLYQWYDITDLNMDISELDKEIETDNYEFIFDSQLRFKTANYSNEFYDLKAYQTVFNNAQAFFNTRNENESEQDNKYIRIEAYYNDKWHQIYAGKITDYDMTLDVAQHELSFECESALFSLKDIYVTNVKGIFSGHKYTNEVIKTQTISGYVVEIIWKLFREIGVQGKYNKASGLIVSNGTLSITIPNHDIKVGELIKVQGSIAYDGLYIVTNVEPNVVHVKTRMPDTGTYLNDKPICYQSRVLFDEDYYKYFTTTYMMTSYNILDLFFISQLWHMDKLDETKCDEFMRFFGGCFNAFSSITYIKGIAYGRFCHLSNANTPKVMLKKDDFIGDFSLQTNWNKQSKSNIIVEDNNVYFTKDTRTLTVNSTTKTGTRVFSFVVSATEKGNNTVEVNDLSDLAVNDEFVFSSHSQKYRIKSISGNTITFTPALMETVKEKDTINLNSERVITLDYADCIYIKLVMPIVYVPCINTQSWEECVEMYYNLSHYNYGAYVLHDKTIYDFTPYSVTIVEHSPLSFIAKANNDRESVNVSCTENILYTDWANKELKWHGTALNNIEGMKICGTSKVPLATTGGYVVNKRESAEAGEIIYSLALIYTWLTEAQTGNRTVLLNLKPYLDKSVTSDISHCGYYNYERVAEIDSHSAFSSGGEEYVLGNYLNANVLSPTRDENIYFSTTLSASELIKRSDIFSRMPSVNVMTGTPPSNIVITDLCISYGENTTNKKAGFVIADYGNSLLWYVPFDTKNWSDRKVLAGGGETILNEGESCEAADVRFDRMYGVWKCYDDVIFCTDRYALYCVYNGYVYCLKRDANLMRNRPRAIDFIHAFNYDDMDNLLNNRLIDIKHIACISHSERISKRRRIVVCELDWEEYAKHEFNIGDVVTLDKEIVNTNNNNVNFWIDKISIDFVNRIIKLTLLEC